MFNCKVLNHIASLNTDVLRHPATAWSVFVSKMQVLVRHWGRDNARKRRQLT